VSDTIHAAAPSASFLDRHHFILRRLHSFTGIAPIGVFLVIHLITNSSIVWGKLGLRGEKPDATWVEGGVAYFVKEVQWINAQIPHLFLLELTLWGAIAFHAILGVIYIRTGRANVSSYGYADNRRYKWQRLTGYIAIFYIFYHIATLRWGWTFLIPPFDGSVKWSHSYAASTMAAALKGSNTGWSFWGVVVSAFYFIGITASVFHFANGLWTAAITWGLTVSAKAQRRWGVVCLAMGAGLMVAAWGSLFGFLMLDVGETRMIESYTEGPAEFNPPALETGEPPVLPPDEPILAQ
jgi:succinate dehydrogenase / fumarate reductase cytochrome b subunit